MDPAPPLPPRPPGPTPPAAGELVVHNGRLTGTRRPLSGTLTFVGRGEGCDVRLNVDGVSPLHCVLAHGADGLVVRDCQSEAGTFVNGERVASRAIHHGDVLGVGPFQFRVWLPAAGTAQAAQPPPPEPTPGDKEALRIQTAAVAAQQAALDEEEDRLQQRRAGLEQQEGQLAAHLEERRRQLGQLREQARAARAALQRERAFYHETVPRSRQDLTQAKKEVVEAQELAQAERQRLIALRRRLKQRWHRHWAV